MEPSQLRNMKTSFTLHEKLYLKYIQTSLDQKISNKVSPIFLAATQNEHTNFRTFVEKNYPDHKLDKDIKLKTIISSLFDKVTDDLQEILTTDELKMEIQCMANAYVSILKRNQSGQMLTLKQAKVMALYASRVNVPAPDKENFPPYHYTDPYSEFATLMIKGCYPGIEKEIAKPKRKKPTIKNNNDSCQCENCKGQSIPISVENLAKIIKDNPDKVKITVIKK